jgi:hypothetical protein
MRLLWAAASLSLPLSFGFLVSCGGAGPYGYAPRYAPTSEESAATSGAREYDPVMFTREPEAWRRTPVSLFGIVSTRTPGPGGAAYLTLSVRRLETRNLCANANDESSCRVTVTDRDFGVVHAVVALRPEDDVGERSVAAGSLVRVVGKLGKEIDAGDGAPVLRGTFYRHWPRHFYVTSSSSELMRQ